MVEGARAYVEDGRRPGGFLYAAVCNDLVGAYCKADSTNRIAIGYWAKWLVNDCPEAAWGSEEKVEAWIDQGGLNGRSQVTGDESDE